MRRSLDGHGTHYRYDWLSAAMSVGPSRAVVVGYLRRDGGSGLNAVKKKICWQPASGRMWLWRPLFDSQMGYASALSPVHHCRSD